MGHNGGPDWRALLAGDDPKAVETLARFANPADVPKTLAEQRAEITRLQQQAKASTRLADNATSEQVAEYRKAIGLPDIGKDAKPDDFMNAYKIEPPKGYDLTEAEKAQIGDYAKLAYEQGDSPREVKRAVDFFFKQQAAQQQVLNKVNVDFHRAEHNGLRDEYGSKEYDAQLAAATSWIDAQFKGEDGTVDEAAKNNILNAQLPGGGRLGDSSFLFKIAAKMALGEGYSAQIEANTLESGGKSLGEQQREIENMRFSNKAGYDAAMKPGGMYEKIINARIARKEIDENGNERRPR